MAPSFFLLFWCVVEIVSYGLCLLLIAILFWPMTRSRGQAPATEERLGGGPHQWRSGHARRAGVAEPWLRVVEAQLAALVKRYAIDTVLAGLARCLRAGPATKGIVPIKAVLLADIKFFGIAFFAPLARAREGGKKRKAGRSSIGESKPSFS